MNLETINHWISLTANIGVLFGLIFLAIEIQQSNNIATASAEADLRENANVLNQSISQNSEFASVVAKLTDISPQLTPGEREQAKAYAGHNLNLWSAATRAYERGLISDYTIDIYTTDVDATLNMYPGTAELFAELASAYMFEPGMSPIFDRLLLALKERGY